MKNMKVLKIFMITGLAVSMLSSCKEDDMFDNLGSSSSGEYQAQLRVTLNTRRPAVGDSVILTANAAHRSDKIKSVEFVATQVEKYGVNIELGATTVTTYNAEDGVALMIVVDTIVNNVVWKSIDNAGGALNDYFVASTNNYVVNGVFKNFEPTELEDEDLIQSLPNEAFEILKNQLAPKITVADYLLLFPTAPNEHFVMSGATKTAVSATGKAYLRENLQKDNLISGGLVSAKKAGTILTKLTVKLTSENQTVSTVSNDFETPY